MKTNILIAGLIATGLAMPHTHAATSSANFNVKASVERSCLMTTPSDLDFGAYVPGGGNRIATSSFNLRCTRDTPWELSISKGSSGTYTMRTMLNGSQTLQYNLYTDAFRSWVWGDANEGTGILVGIGTGLSPANQQPITIHGFLPDNLANQDAAVGSYQETLVLTIQY